MGGAKLACPVSEGTSNPMSFSLTEGQTCRGVQQLIPLKLARAVTFSILRQCVFRSLFRFSLSLWYRNPFPPPQPWKNVSCLQANKKKRFTFCNFEARNLLPWYSLEKGRDSRTVVLAPQIRLFLIPWWAIPFWSSLRQKSTGSPKQRLRPLEKPWYWLEGMVGRQRRLLAGNSCLAVLMQVVYLFQTFTSYLRSLIGRNCHT